MSEAPEPREARAETFYGGAYARMARIMAVLALLTSAALLVLFDWRVALGFVAGSAAGMVNFFWLKSAAAQFAEAAAGGGRPGGAMVAKFLIRYALLAAVVYVIFKGSTVSVYAFLAGLFLPVAAAGCEAAYEAWVAVRHDI